ncbi:MAG: hypothetical protein LQ352_007096 [Teloschistes flavicans]|nr:MAG: hypothetical protein LQ352_007096 [Teloschistes flavicans]
MAHLVPGALALHDQDFHDPNFSLGQAPQAPTHPPGQPRKSQIVWPRDKKQKGPHTWDRWKDLFSGKGPDMWVGRQGDNGPNRNAWSHWGYGGEQLPDNLGYRDERDGGVAGPDGWHSWMGNRSVEEKYDFKTRRYQKPHDTVWSDVKWDRKGQNWLYVRSRFGGKHTRAEIWHRMTDGELALANHWNLHPFDYKSFTPHWDWYRDEMPLDWYPTTEEAWPGLF